MKALILLSVFIKINKLEYYNRQKELWGDSEIQNLKSEYEKELMTISQIADIHHRTPGSISYKLMDLSIIPHNRLSRGHLEYKNSNLYKEIVEVSQNTKAEKILIKEVKQKEKIKSSTDSLQIKEISEMRNDILILKKDVKEILRLMNALYDFESST